MITLDDVKRLAGVAGPCLTVMQPLRDPFSQVTRPETRVAAALQQAEQTLKDNRIPEDERTEFLRPLNKLLTNTPWAGRTGTFLLFRSPEFAKASFWPETLPSRLSYGDEFLVLPLLPGLEAERNFWLLALSINKILLLRGTPEGLTEVELPASLARSLEGDEAFAPPDHTLANRSSAGSFSGAQKGVGFTTSTLNETKPSYLHDFFREIDREIRPILSRDPHPLIVAGVERELAIYRSVNTWAQTVPGGLPGNPVVAGYHALYARAIDLLTAEAVASRLRECLAEVDAAADHRLLLTDPTEICDAARAGQVRHLIATSAGPWEEVINSAALATIRNGGDVTVAAALPLATGVAGILRYRMVTEEAPQTAASLSTA